MVTDETTLVTTTTRPTSTSTVTTATLAPTTTQAGPAVLWPLTGLEVEAGVVQNGQEVLIAKFSNAPKARPQQGLSEADILMEVPVEGGVLRILAVFHSSIPETIGPLRSAREVDPKLIEPFDSFFVSSGGQPTVLSKVRQVATVVSDGSGPGFFRESGRSAPYNLFLQTEEIFGLAELSTEPEFPLVFDSAVPDGDRALTVEIDISSFATTNYRYSSSDDGYLRFNGEAPHETVDGEQLVAQNVVAIFAERISTGRFDGAGAPVPDYDVIGSGTAFVFRDGVAIQGVWERGQSSDFFRLFDANGDVIPLRPGQTWFEIVPTDRTVDWQ